MKCPHARGCELYPKLSVVIDFWKTFYCDSDKHMKCARFQLLIQGMPVASTLLPNGKFLIDYIEQKEKNGP